jgi:hypothetical protein
MWTTLLAVNSFAVMPIVTIFLVYATGYGILFWHWKLFLFALALFVIAVIAQGVLAILTEG